MHPILHRNTTVLALSGRMQPLVSARSDGDVIAADIGLEPFLAHLPCIVPALHSLFGADELRHDG